MKKIVKNGIIFVFLLSLLFVSYIYRGDIAKYVLKNYILKREIITYKANTYTKNNDFNYIKKTDHFYPTNKNELMQIFYTFLNNGWDEFTFYCDENYKDCLKDVNTVINDENGLNNINNFVHPFNSFQNFNIVTTELNEISIQSIKLYSKEEINIINQKIDIITSNIIKDTMSVKEKIKAFHDYIINNSTYDIEEAKKIENSIPSNTLSHKATNVLLNGLGLCGGYSDTMAIYLSKLGLTNYKIANEEHIWNYVLIDNEWYHIDATWDDPVTTDKSNVLIHDFFLIKTIDLEKMDTKKHLYNKDIYLEAK